MATETLRPTGELSTLGLGVTSFTDFDHDPDSDTTTVDPNGNGVNTEWGGDFNTPTGNPTVGAGLQEFRVGVIRFETGQTGVPLARIELWENGVLVRAGSDEDVTGTHSIVSFTWDASELGTPDGSLVQCKLIGTKIGGAGSARAAVGIGGMEWNVDYTVGGGTSIPVAMNHYAKQRRN